MKKANFFLIMHYFVYHSKKFIINQTQNNVLCVFKYVIHQNIAQW